MTFGSLAVVKELCVFLSYCRHHPVEELYLKRRGLARTRYPDPNPAVLDQWATNAECRACLRFTWIEWHVFECIRSVCVRVWGRGGSKDALWRGTDCIWCLAHLPLLPQVTQRSLRGRRSSWELIHMNHMTQTAPFFFHLKHFGPPLPSSTGRCIKSRLLSSAMSSRVDQAFSPLGAAITN